MRFDIVTLFPEMFVAISDYGITGRALEQDIYQLNFWNPRDYTQDKHKMVDDRPYGGGPGMVLKVQPMADAITAAKSQAGNVPVVYLSPQGQRLDQDKIRQVCQWQGMILVAGRYEGIDERLHSYFDEEWSIGDYVLSGGELAAMVLMDGIIRNLPGALGHEDSAQLDSFSDGILDCPHYTRPEVINGERVPEVLLQGNHQEIARWRRQQALGKTWLVRPDLLGKLSHEDEDLLEEFKQQYKVK